MEHRHRLRRGAPAAYETDAMKKYVGRVPARAGRSRPARVRGGRALHPRQPARDQGAQRRLAGCADGAKSPAQAMKDAQAEAERILQAVSIDRPARSRPLPLPSGAASRGRVGGGLSAVRLIPYPVAQERRPPPRSVCGAATQHDSASRHLHGWLLLLPALALLAPFTHWPALATFIDSFFSTPRPRRPARFVGLDNYPAMVDDPVFWQALLEQPLVRARHHPALDRARAPDGALGQRPHRRARAGAHGVFHARPCCR